MQTTAKLYTDIDYESFPIADLDLDLHWIQLPNSVLAARRQAKLEALDGLGASHQFDGGCQHDQ